MTHMTRYTSARPGADVIFRDLEGEAVLLDLASGRYFGLNPVGTRIWVLLDAGSTVDAVVAAIAAEFEADPDEVARDVDELLTELIAKGLVVAGTGPAAPGP
jgi:hypothetical protein